MTIGVVLAEALVLQEDLEVVLVVVDLVAHPEVQLEILEEVSQSRLQAVPEEVPVEDLEVDHWERLLEDHLICVFHVYLLYREVVLHHQDL